MSMGVQIGILLSLAAGMMSGNCMLPMKFVRKWQWENTWLVFTIFSLVVLPWGLALAVVNNLGRVYATLPPGEYTAPFLFGFGWGIAQVLFGLSVARLGLALSYAVIIGLGSLLGTLVPLLVQRLGVLGTPRGALILTGLAVMVAGIVVSGSAGRLRERAEAAAALRNGAGYTAALVMAVVCGIMAPMLNYSFAFGQGIAEHAMRLGNSAARAGYAVWPVGLAGGLIPNLGYSIYLLNRRGTWGVFRSRPADSKMALWMAVLWTGAFAVYGLASVYLGDLGTSAGWALFQIFMIITANVSGILTGEWKRAPRRSFRLLCLGLALLAVATVQISLGNR